MIRTALAALLLCAIPALHAETKKTTAPDKAPKTVEQIKALTRDGFYNNLAWFRVIPNFIAQTGYPKGSNGKSELPDLPDEFNDYPFVRGTVGMGHSQQPNSANSQFFICFEDAGFLNRQYTVWGQVIEGMDNVDKIKKGGEHNNGTISGDPDKIVKARIETA